MCRRDLADKLRGNFSATPVHIAGSRVLLSHFQGLKATQLALITSKSSSAIFLLEQVVVKKLNFLNKLKSELTSIAVKHSDRTNKLYCIRTNLDWFQGSIRGAVDSSRHFAKGKLVR